MALSHCYWHLVVQNGNFTLLLTSSGQEWQFHTATDILFTSVMLCQFLQYLSKYVLLSFSCFTTLNQKSLLVSFHRCRTQWQRFESSRIHHFWDTPQHFLKTHFCLESGFLSFLELQKALLVTFQGCWTLWHRFDRSSIHHFWDTPTAFSQNRFLLRKWLTFVPRAPEIPTSKFSGMLNTMAKVWKL